MEESKILIKSPSEHDEFYTEENCHILEILNETDDRSQSVARARVEPGQTTKWHRLKHTSESYYILEGQGQVQLDEDVIKNVTKGDVVRIPPNIPQRIQNTGVNDLVFLCFCTPAFGVENYESLE